MGREWGCGHKKSGMDIEHWRGVLNFNEHNGLGAFFAERYKK